MVVTGTGLCTYREHACGFTGVINHPQRHNWSPAFILLINCRAPTGSLLHGNQRTVVVIGQRSLILLQCMLPSERDRKEYRSKSPPSPTQWTGGSRSLTLQHIHVKLDLRGCVASPRACPPARLQGCTRCDPPWPAADSTIVPTVGAATGYAGFLYSLRSLGNPE
jgi:hypothetical protein